MKYIRCFAAFFIALILAGCQTSKGTFTVEDNPHYSLEATLTATPFQKLTQRSFVETTSRIPQVTPTVLLNEPVLAIATPKAPLESRITHQCLELSTTGIGGTKFSGVLVLNVRNSGGDHPDTTFLLNLKTGKVTQVNQPEEYAGIFSISPDRKLMEFIAGETLPMNKLVIATATGKRLLELPTEADWNKFKWLDNRRLIHDIGARNPDGSYVQKAPSLEVIDPFTMERRVLEPDFPNIYDLLPIPSWDVWGITVYNSQLTHVVYLGINGKYVNALWDMKRQKILAEVNADFEMPRWSPDGDQVAMNGISRGENFVPLHNNSWDMYIVSKEGVVKQLTNIGKFMDVHLTNYSWSPDGSQLAAWMMGLAEDEIKLVTIDTVTGQITDYCLQLYEKNRFGKFGPNVSPPIWSPDGNHLAVTIINDISNVHPRVFLLDLKNGVATQFEENMEAFGWMVAP